jgi:hypothetical protein
MVTNVKAPCFLTVALAPAMARRGKGKIINITMVAYFGMPGASGYGASKAAMQRQSAPAPSLTLPGATFPSSSFLKYRERTPPSGKLGIWCVPRTRTNWNLQRLPDRQRRMR